MVYRCLHCIGHEYFSEDFRLVSRDLFSPATAFGLQYRPTLWFLPHAGLHLATAHSRSQELERGTRYRSVPLCIPVTSENISVSRTTASIILTTVSWYWSACTEHHANPGELNWTNPNGHMYDVYTLDRRRNTTSKFCRNNVGFESWDRRRFVDVESPSASTIFRRWFLRWILCSSHVG